MRLQLLLVCPECEQTLTPEQMAYGHDCEVHCGSITSKSDIMDSWQQQNSEN